LTAPITVYRASDVLTIELPCYRRDDGEIVVAEGSSHMPFAIARMFTLRAPLGVTRGQHAHRRCSLLLLCVHGAVDVVNDDSSDRRTFTLDRGNVALLVPPTIWHSLIFRATNSVLVVLCDRHFQEEDYIREYPDFLAFRKAIGS
jgi:dTDP-4-dehydrorhamnose 3,5-epimerase-like enzyme